VLKSSRSKPYYNGPNSPVDGKGEGCRSPSRYTSGLTSPEPRLRAPTFAMQDFPLHGQFKPMVLLTYLPTPLSEPQLANPLVLSRGSVRYSLPHADSAGQSFLNSFYDRHYSSRFEMAP
jgi:hypothetical protein